LGVFGGTGVSHGVIAKRSHFSLPPVFKPQPTFWTPTLGDFWDFGGFRSDPPPSDLDPKSTPDSWGIGRGRSVGLGIGGVGGWGRGVPNRGKNAFYRVLFWCKSTMRYNQGSPKNGLKKGFFDPQTPPENPPIFGHFLDHPSDPRSGLLCRNPKIWETGSDRSVEGPCGATPNWETESDRSVRDA